MSVEPFVKFHPAICIYVVIKRELFKIVAFIIKSNLLSSEYCNTNLKK